ncbi:MgtC/SapB family protein [Lacimicrobium sp. SS2-24]|uniref:MgtC/SapB family protein n=1 Tax=Lacimicrobium sp. SS2-24 TaxID=2005569 RepID=UPI000B4BB214|nr:MgtC/SapB family protein [Lacimicrobium sp. SS2-24]
MLWGTLPDYIYNSSFVLLGISLAIGLLIGIERGWKQRTANEGHRIAGLRTYGLTGLAGGCSAIMQPFVGQLTIGLLFLGFALAVSMAYLRGKQHSEDASITSLVSLLLTYMLGMLAAFEQIELAASAAIITALLLRYKELLHGWLRQLEDHELKAGLQLLLISIVLLPVLPDQGYGPWQVLNPYEIWWMVVLIAGISFVGYFAMKFAGTDKGIILTALSAGLASSTALTLHFSRLAREQTSLQRQLSAGILIACGTMFPRVVLIATLINPALLSLLWWPMAVMMLVILLSAGLLWKTRAVQQPASLTRLLNPLALQSAVLFGGLLMVILLLGQWMRELFGDTGIYALALVSGIADVDPINLTLARMSLDNTTLTVAVSGIVIAACSNSLVKAIMAVSIAGKAMLFHVLLPLLGAISCGLLSLLMV